MTPTEKRLADALRKCVADMECNDPGQESLRNAQNVLATLDQPTDKWANAPEWAKWLAMDKDGEWYWFEEKPVREKCTWQCDLGKCKITESVRLDWRESLEERK